MNHNGSKEMLWGIHRHNTRMQDQGSIKLKHGDPLIKKKLVNIGLLSSQNTDENQNAESACSKRQIVECLINKNSDTIGKMKSTNDLIEFDGRN